MKAQGSMSEKESSGICLARKIHIIGGPGSGKSYIASEISTAYNIAVFDLDEIFWDRTADRYGAKASQGHRDAALSDILERGTWIIEGVYHSWLAPCFEAADLIIILSPSVWLRDWRILKRFLKRKLGLVGSKKESVSDLWRLLKWNHRYDSDNLRRACVFIQHLSHKTIYCRTAAEVLGMLQERNC